MAEQFLLLGESLVERQGAGRFDAVDAALRRLEAAPLDRGAFARRGENGRVHAGHLVGQVTYFFEWCSFGYECAREGERPFAQTALVDEFVDHPDRVRLAGRQRRATGDDLQCGFGSDQPRQPLRAAASG